MYVDMYIYLATYSAWISRCETTFLLVNLIPQKIKKIKSKLNLLVNNMAKRQVHTSYKK